MIHHRRDQRKVAEFKREMHEELDDDTASYIEELLAKDHEHKHEQQSYRDQEAE